MQKHVLNFTLCSCLAGLSLSVASADQVVLKNGDRVTGSIIKKDAKTITIKTEHWGVITAPWEQVESVKADAPLNVVLDDGKTVQGTLSTAGDKMQVATKEATLNVTPSQVTTIRNDDEQKAYERLLEPGWSDLWAGGGSIGLAGTSGNAKTLTFTTGFNAARVTNSDKTSLYFNAIKASALVNGVSAGTAQAVRGGIGYNHNVSSRLFVNTFNDYEYDKFQNLDLRFVIGGGLGDQAVKNERSRLELVCGAEYNHENFNTPLTRNSAEAYWGDDYHYKLSNASSFFQSFRMFNNLSDTGSYRMNADIGMSTKLTQWLNWTLSLSDRYLNRPAPGRKTNDWLYSTGFGFTFGK